MFGIPVLVIKQHEVMFRIACFICLLAISRAWLWGSREKCYGEYGCFSTRSPFNNAKGNYPDSPEKQGISFRLYTRGNQNDGQVISDTDHSSITNSNFSPNLKTILIVHGYTDSGDVDWIIKMKNELLNKEAVNVIAVNWSPGSKQAIYFKAAANTRVVGAVAAQLIKDLNTLTGVSFSSFHVVGHSLGSHIGGYIGEIIPGLGRITGLDPAGLGFENYDPIVRLDPDDADYVDVIHTDAESVLALGWGMEKAIGDSDFYPNGGTNQPGCPNKPHLELVKVLLGQKIDFAGVVACSHSRAIDFFTSSINAQCTFTGYPCTETEYKNGQCNSCGSGCGIMGYNSDPQTSGRFYLTTTASEPYCA